MIAKADAEEVAIDAMIHQGGYRAHELVEKAYRIE
jgi:hypothetical protein